MGVGRRRAGTSARAAALLAAACLTATANAQTAGPRDVPLGGRPSGLGHAYSALADDAYAPAWNPAGLGFEQVPQAAMLHAASVGGAPSEQALLALPLPAGFGAGASLDFSRGGSAYGASVGRRFTEHAAFGASARALEGSAAQGRPRGTAADLAAFYRFDGRLTVGAVAANLGGRPQALQETGSQTPQARLGAGYSPASWLTWALEGVMQRGGQAGVRTGVELLAWRALAARVGIDSTVEGSPALGLTAGLGLTWGSQSVDLAYVPDGRDSWEQASLVVRFGRLPDRPSAASRGFALPAPPGARERESLAPAPGRSSREQPRTFHFDAASSTATVVGGPPPAVVPSVSGFTAPAADPDWRKPKTPEIPENPNLQQPVPPGMIWLQQ